MYTLNITKAIKNNVSLYFLQNISNYYQNNTIFTLKIRFFLYKITCYSNFYMVYFYFCASLYIIMYTLKITKAISTTSIFLFFAEYKQ